MKIVTVSPLDKSIFKEELTYFSSLPVKIGSIVEIEVRNKKTKALVLDTKPASDLKTDLRNLDFKLKKIINLTEDNLYTPDFLTACQKLADTSLAPLGHIIKHYTPKIILDKNIKLELIDNKKENDRTEKFCLQENKEERYVFYKQLIREQLAQKKKVVIVSPTNEEAKYIKNQLNKGIEDYTTVLTSDTKNKDILKKINQFKLIITTPLFISLLKGNIGAIIIEKENDKAWKNFIRPFIDSRQLLEFLADNLKCKLFLGDDILSLETFYRLGKNELIPAIPIKYRLTSPASQTLAIIENQEIVSKELIALINYCIKENKKLFIFNHRKGLKPVTICLDCKQIVSCDYCNIPLVLYEKTEKNRSFVCHKCLKEIKVFDQCKNCQSWKLSAIGSGVDDTYQIIKDNFPKEKMFKIDSNENKILEIINKFNENRGGVLIGTEVALPYLKELIPAVACTSFDTLFSIPDFKIQEKMFNLFIKARNLASEHFLIETRKTDEEIFNLVLQGNILDFHREELALRKQYSYPPFSTIIKIIKIGKKNQVIQEIEEVLDTLKDYKTYTSTPLYSTNDKYQMNIIIKINDIWPNPNLSNILKRLGPDWFIQVNPESTI